MLFAFTRPILFIRSSGFVSILVFPLLGVECAGQAYTAEIDVLNIARSKELSAWYSFIILLTFLSPRIQ